MVRPWCILCHAAEYTCRFGISKWDLTIYNWKSNTVLTKPTIWCCWYSMYSILPMLLVPVVQEPGINISVVPKCCLWLHGTTTAVLFNLRLKCFYETRIHLNGYTGTRYSTSTSTRTPGATFQIPNVQTPGIFKYMSSVKRSYLFNNSTRMHHNMVWD